MFLPKRIIYNTQTGIILNNCLNERFDSGLTEETINELRPKEISFLDLEYGSTILDNVLEYHIDVQTKQIIVDKYIEHIETDEEKLRREKEELENQLLLKENKDLGGIL